MLSATKIVAIGGLLLAFGIICGASGAHALKQRLDPYLLTVWDKAVLYHLVHAGALLAVGIMTHVQLLTPSAGARLAITFLLGIVLFSGSLYLLALTGTRWLGAITPIGGVAFIVGWLLLALGVLRK